jgi:hypothetical protein
MTKISAITEKTFQGKVTGYAITLDNGVVGNLSDKDSDKGLKAGDEVTAIIKDYISKAGKHSNLITLKKVTGDAPAPPTQPPVPTPAPAKPQNAQISSPTVQAQKASATVKAMEFVVNCFIQDKISWDKIKDYHKEITIYLWDAIEECSQA